jgi:hypothetical protein
MTEPIILTVPEAISERARQIAKATEQPAEQVLLAHLQTLSPPLPALPPDEQAELDALKHLSDDALWTIAREQMPDDVQKRAHDLMTKNSRGEISPEEYSELEKLVERSDRLMVRKAEAAAILRERGYFFVQSDFSSRHE